MKKIFTVLIASSLIFLSSCIYFQNINQPSIVLPNEIFTVSIAVTTEGGDREPYFGVCLPIGWTIPGDSLQCSGVYNEVIYYDSLISLEQENASPAPAGYYWWAGKGVVDTSAIGEVYGDLQIQTDSQIGTFSIDYMLGHSGGCGSGGVNLQRSNGHLIQIAEGAVITSVAPDQGYQNFSMDINIDGFNTHFSDGPGTQNVWLSQNNNEIYANSFIVHSNTSLTANFYIPLTAPIGLYDVNIETYVDSIITKTDGFETLPPPPLIYVDPDSLEIVLEPGSSGTKTLTISNTGGSDLHFNISGPNYYTLQFDGVDDYTEIQDSPELNMTDQITISCWMNHGSNNFTQWESIIHKGNSEWGFYFIDGGKINFELLVNGSHRQCTSNIIPVTGEWYHVAGTYDGSEMKIFINGILENTFNVNGTITNSNYNLFFGKDMITNGRNYNGKLDEVRIWNIARTEIEIQQNMYREILEIEPGLVGYLQFNEGIGYTAFDKSPYGNHGILHNGVTWSDSSAPILSLPDWLHIVPGSGICEPNSAIDVIVSFDATEVDSCYYYFNLTILSNDPFHPKVTIPVHMLVSPIIPVELISFTASASKDNVVLNWSTVTEINNSGFEIQRKLNDSNWTVREFKDGAGTTTKPRDYSFIDDIADIKATSISYRLKQIDYDGSFEYSDEVFVDCSIPKDFILEQNFPNPFNPVTTIKYSIPTESDVSLMVYNTLGEEIVRLVNESKKVGNYEVNFDAAVLPSGVYLYQIKAGSFVKTKKMILLK